MNAKKELERAGPCIELRSRASLLCAKWKAKEAEREREYVYVTHTREREKEGGLNCYLCACVVRYAREREWVVLVGRRRRRVD